MVSSSALSRWVLRIHSRYKIKIILQVALSLTLCSLVLGLLRSILGLQLVILKSFKIILNMSLGLSLNIDFLSFLFNDLLLLLCSLVLLFWLLLIYELDFRSFSIAVRLLILDLLLYFALLLRLIDLCLLSLDWLRRCLSRFLLIQIFVIFADYLRFS